VNRDETSVCREWSCHICSVGARAICSVNRGFRQDSRYQRHVRECSFEEIFADVPIQLPARI
jgi:hypothetical protein